MQLAAFTADHFPMGQSAMQVNEGLPAYIVSALERRYGSLHGKTVGILGMAFKAESDDTRASLSFKLRKLLAWAGARVLCTDPFVADDRLVPLDEVIDRERDRGARRPAPGLPRAVLRVRTGRRRHLGRPRRRDPAVRVLVTGAAGFICGYLVPDLLERGHEVVGVDDFSKYGPLTKSYDDHPRYRFVQGDAKDVGLLTELASDCDQVVAAAAMIGGISYFHEFAYDLIAENERILASTFDAAIAAHRAGRLERIVVLSSSMVYESATVFPTPEGAQLTSPPPISTYGFQKLASEYFARGAHEQYGLPYTILRPFNCVGIGERRAVRDTDVMSGNVKLALSHVVPDLVAQGAQGPGPAPHPRRRPAGPPLHLRRRPGPGDPDGDGVAGGGRRRLQPLDGGEHDRARAGRGDLAQGPRARSAVPVRVGSAVRARRPDARARRPQGARGPRLRGDDDARRDARRGHPVDPAPRRRQGGSE